MKFYLIVPMNHHYKMTDTIYLPKYNFVLKYRFVLVSLNTNIPERKKIKRKTEVIKALIFYSFHSVSKSV